jgi:mannonate dehydratase
MKNRLYDYIRIHISQIGGIPPAMKDALLGEWFNTRASWHGSCYTSPAGHSANGHNDYAIWNFEMQKAAEVIRSPEEKVVELFCGMPTVSIGFMSVSDTLSS